MTVKGALTSHDRVAVAVGVLLFYSLLPLLTQLPITILVIGLSAFILRPLLYRKRVWQWLSILAGLAGGGVALWLSPFEWLSGKTLVSVLMVVLSLKWLEAHRSGEFVLLSYGALILLVLSSLYLNGLPSLMYLIVGTLLLLNALITITNPQQSLLPRMTLVGKILLLGLPISAMLFITVPRIQGPLWDLGIVMGLPIELVIDQDEREQGIKGTLRAGQVSRLKKSDAPVLVAEFQSTVPYKSRLYWRGPVFSRYDGVSWHLPDNWDSRSRLLSVAFKKKGEVLDVLTSKSDIVSYEARVSAHGSRWLYALDMPVGRSTESFISEDFQLLGIRRVTMEFNYDQQAYLEYTGGRQLTAEQRAIYLQLPDHSNERLIAWGRTLGEDPIQRLRVHLAEGGYQVTETPDIAEYKNSLDEFFFDRKEGGIEHLAGATVVALRAAGVPARLVSGYRGGSLIALTNFIVVRQGDAHVWVEAWRDATGWQRVEAKDYVAPPALETRQPAVPKKTSGTKTPKERQKTASSMTSANAAKTSKPKPTQLKKQVKASTGWLTKLSSDLETWVLNYDSERQIELMQKSGLRQVDWKSLLAVMVGGLFLMLILYSALLTLRRPTIDPVNQAFNRLNKVLAKHGLACAENECPQHWQLRLQQAQLPLYPALEQVVQQYLRLRYEVSDSGDCEAQKEAIQCFQRDVKRFTAML